MKRIFTLLTLCLLATTVWGYTVVFDATVDIGTSPGTAAPFTIEKDGVTVNVSNGLANGAHYRVYKNSSITICALSGNITNIVFECTVAGDAQYGPGCFTVNVGSYAIEDKIGEWNGCAECVTFTAVLNQVRITKIIVTVEEGGLSVPVIQPASGTYFGPIEVSISCYTPDATIYYTTDGTDPNTLSPVYSSPFTASHDMTVKAVAVLDGEVSDIASAEYAFRELPGYGCFGDLESLDNGTEVFFSSPVYAVAQHGNYLFAKDGCGGYALIWGNTGQTYDTGDVIPAGFVVTKSFYSGEMELKDPQYFKPASGSITIQPEPFDPDQFGPDMFAHYVILECATISTEDGRNYVATDTCGHSIPLYFNMGASVPVDLSRFYDITGVIGSYGQEPIYQLLPTKISIHKNIGIGLGNYWNYYDSANPQASITFDYDATVILQAGSYLYAKDETGYGLIYGNVGQTYKHGDVIPAKFSGRVTYYDGWPELTSPFTGFKPSINHVPVIPEEVTIPQVNPDLWAHYLLFKQVYIDPEKKVIRDQYGNELPIYIRSGLPFTFPEDCSKLVDIRGLLTYYHGQPQLLVWDDEQIPIPVFCLQDCKNDSQFMNGKPFRIKLIAIYKNGANLYVQDLCGEYILMYGNIAGEFVNGDTIEGVAHFAKYQGHLQLVPEGDWVILGHGKSVEPDEIPCTEEISQDMCHFYVRFEQVKLVTEDGKTYIEDDCGRLLLFNKFDITIPNPGEMPITDVLDLNEDGEVNIADLNYLIDLILSGKIDYHWIWIPHIGPTDRLTYDVEGFISVYKNELEIFPIRISRFGSHIIIMGDLNGDNEINIADLNVMIDMILNK